jgi:hypothetical protein
MTFRELARAMAIDDATMVRHIDALLRDFVDGRLKGFASRRQGRCAQTCALDSRFVTRLTITEGRKIRTPRLVHPRKWRPERSKRSRQGRRRWRLPVPQISKFRLCETLRD